MQRIKENQIMMEISFFIFLMSYLLGFIRGIKQVTMNNKKDMQIYRLGVMKDFIVILKNNLQIDVLCLILGMTLVFGMILLYFNGFIHGIGVINVYTSFPKYKLLFLFTYGIIEITSYVLASLSGWILTYNIILIFLKNNNEGIKKHSNAIKQMYFIFSISIGLIIISAFLEAIFINYVI